MYLYKRHYFFYLLLIFNYLLCATASLINFSEVPCENGYGQSKIVGGSDATPGEFPWLVSLTRRGYHFCGGTIISRRHVLTAGHCICNGVDGYIKPGSIKITTGQHDLTSPGNTQEMFVKEITAHPEYKCNKARNDIAILELGSDVTWSNFVQPACFSTQFLDDKYATVAGWGRTSENNTGVNTQKASVLQKAKVSIFNNDDCRDWYQSQGKKTKIHQTQLCAGRKEGGVDACWADSGGPLMVEDDNNQSIVGIVSTGIGCARPFLPGIYTRVSEFLTWIQSEVDKSNFVA